MSVCRKGLKTKAPQVILAVSLLTNLPYLTQRQAQYSSFLCSKLFIIKSTSSLSLNFEFLLLFQNCTEDSDMQSIFGNYILQSHSKEPKCQESMPKDRDGRVQRQTG